MYQPLGEKALAHLSAALRHVRDAEYLAEPGAPYRSPDQAYHLAGFGPECARKATLHGRLFDQALGHALGPDTVALEFVLAIDPAAHRYEPRSWAARFPALTRWSPDCRYERTGTRDPADMIREAGELVDRITTALWADGRLPPSFLAQGGR